MGVEMRRDMYLGSLRGFGCMVMCSQHAKPRALRLVTGFGGCTPHIVTLNLNWNRAHQQLHAARDGSMASGSEW